MASSSARGGSSSGGRDSSGIELGKPDVLQEPELGNEEAPAAPLDLVVTATAGEGEKRGGGEPGVSQEQEQQQSQQSQDVFVCYKEVTYADIAKNFSMLGLLAFGGPVRVQYSPSSRHLSTLVVPHPHPYISQPLLSLT